jgi:hypothetical protein
MSGVRSPCCSLRCRRCQSICEQLLCTAFKTQIPQLVCLRCWVDEQGKALASQPAQGPLLPMFPPASTARLTMINCDGTPIGSNLPCILRLFVHITTNVLDLRDHPDFAEHHVKINCRLKALAAFARVPAHPLASLRATLLFAPPPANSAVSSPAQWSFLAPDGRVNSKSKPCLQPSEAQRARANWTLRLHDTYQSLVLDAVAKSDQAAVQETLDKTPSPALAALFAKKGLRAFTIRVTKREDEPCTVLFFALTSASFEVITVPVQAPRSQDRKAPYAVNVLLRPTTKLSVLDILQPSFITPWTLVLDDRDRCLAGRAEIIAATLSCHNVVSDVIYTVLSYGVV